MEPCRQFTEPTIVPDVFTNGAARVVPISGGCVRLTWYVDVPLACDPSEIEHRIVDRLVIPQEAIPELICKLYAALNAVAALDATVELVAKLAH